MNTTSLREFLTLAKTLSFSNAAKELFISQSVLTRHIRELEKEFGVELFLRTTHEVALTEAGRILAGKAPGLLQKCDSARNRLRSHNLPTSGSVRVGLGLEFSYSSHIINDFRQFMSRYPDIKVHYDVLPTRTPSQVIQNYDLFFTPCVFHDLPPTTRSILTRRNGTQVILPPNHPLMSKSAVYLHQLAGQTIIVPYADEAFGPYYQNYLLAEKAAKGRLSRIAVENLSTALFLVSMGKGICIAPQYVKNMLSPNTFVLTVSDQNCRFDEYLYFNKSDNGAAELLFLELQERL